MLDWVLRPTNIDAQRLNRIKTPEQADRYNDAAGLLVRRNLSCASPTDILQTIGNPQHVLFQGALPEISDPKAPDFRSRLVETLLTRCYGPIVHIYSQPSPLGMYLSRLSHGQDVRRGSVDQFSTLLTGVPAELWLDALTDPAEGAELLLYLRSISEFLENRSLPATPERILQLLADPSPMVPDFPPPADGRIDPFFVSPEKRLLLQRRFQLLQQEQSGRPDCGEFSLLSGALSGRNCSFYCGEHMQYTRKLLFRQVRELACRMPFTLILDTPTGGAEFSSLLRELPSSVSTLLYCRDLPRLVSHDRTQLFQVLSRLDGIFLAEMGDSAGAGLWSGYFDSFESAVYSTSRTRGLHLGHGLSPHWDRTANVSSQSRQRLSPDTLLRTLDGTRLLATSGREIYLYE
jgi:hypothetical protein